MKKLSQKGAIIIILALWMIGMSMQSNPPWVAPATANSVQNPQKGNAAATLEGKTIYNKYCVVCHGSSGKGDGVAAAGLQTPPADHSSAKVQAQTDGALYWKLTNGKNPMPGFNTTLKDEQRWDVVNYMRTLAKGYKK